MEEWAIISLLGPLAPIIFELHVRATLKLLYYHHQLAFLTQAVRVFCYRMSNMVSLYKLLVIFSASTRVLMLFKVVRKVMWYSKTKCSQSRDSLRQNSQRQIQSYYKATLLLMATAATNSKKIHSPGLSFMSLLK